ncbi:MAG TPA: hypothetical protein VEZ14_07700 [Dehalococcoidia bacterium]|nr:hypothetical protein [Dehalococcoidia bacterium]
MRPLSPVLVSVALLLASCSGGGKPSTTPTAIRTPTGSAATATVVATPAPVPARPAALADYARAAAQYLTASPAAVRECLKSLYEAWQMPLISPGSGCRTANVDGDAENEIVAVFSAEAPGSGGAPSSEFVVAVLDHGASGYSVAYSSGIQQTAPPGSTQPIDPVLAAGDIVGDGAGALAYVTSSCVGGICTQQVHVVRGTPAGYVDLAPAGGITMVMATDIKVTGANGTGPKQIVLTGGGPGDATTGPRRPQTEVWSWNGTVYALTSTTTAPSPYLYHAIVDADGLFTAGKYAAAAAAYLATVGNTSLQTFYPAKNERPELEAYALFRAGVATLMAGGDRTSADGYLTRANGYSGTLNRQLAGSFEAAYAAKGEVSIGCSAVREDVQANLSEYARFWDFGTSNPAFAPNAVCPF